MFTSAFGHVEGKTARVITPASGGGSRGEQLADVVKEAGISRHVGTRRAANRLLVNPDQPPDILHPARDPAAGARLIPLLQLIHFLLLRGQLVTKVPGHQFDQRLADQTRFARAGNPRNGRENAERKGGIDLMQIIARDPAQPKPADRRTRRTARRRGSIKKIAPGLGILHLRQAGGRPAIEDPSALFAGGRPHVDQPVRLPDDIKIVFHHKKGIAGALQPFESAQQRFGVSGMKAGGRFVEYIDHAEEVGMELGGQAQTLQLARRQGRRAALERKIAEPQIEQDTQACHQIFGDAPGHNRLLGMRGVVPFPAAGRAFGKGRQSGSQTLQ